jgi:hypothetical protein
MKTTIIKAALFITVISLTTIGCSHKTTQGIKDTANKAGNKTAEIASKGAAQITDKVYEGKVGPQGQTIYIDENSKYFYIDNKGHRVFVKESKLKNKED